MGEVPLYPSSRASKRFPVKNKGITALVVPSKQGTESGPLKAVHVSRHKWPGGVVNFDWKRIFAGGSIVVEAYRGTSPIRKRPPP